MTNNERYTLTRRVKELEKESDELRKKYKEERMVVRVLLDHNYRLKRSIRQLKKELGV